MDKSKKKKNTVWRYPPQPLIYNTLPDGMSDMAQVNVWIYLRGAVVGPCCPCRPDVVLCGAAAGLLSDLSPLRHLRDVKAVTDPTLTSAGEIPAL